LPLQPQSKLKLQQKELKKDEQKGEHKIQVMLCEKHDNSLLLPQFLPTTKTVQNKQQQIVLTALCKMSASKQQEGGENST